MLSGPDRCPACGVDLLVSPPVLLPAAAADQGTADDPTDGEPTVLCDSCLRELPAEPGYVRLALCLGGSQARHRLPAAGYRA